MLAVGSCAMARPMAICSPRHVALNVKNVRGSIGVRTSGTQVGTAIQHNAVPT